MNQSLLSASADVPESILDAIMQISVCEVHTCRSECYVMVCKGHIMLLCQQEQVGWRPQGESRRLIFAVTDGDYHYAFDGKVREE